MTALLAVTLAFVGFSPSARAAKHPNLDQALDVLAQADILTGNVDADRAMMQSSEIEAQKLIATEPPGPEFQGHRQAAIERLHRSDLDLKNNRALKAVQSLFHAASNELRSAIRDADDYQPVSVRCAPGAPAVTPAAGGLDFFQMTFIPDSPAQPATPGWTYNKNTQVPDVNDPDAVIRG